MHAELLERIVTNTKRASQIIDRIRSYIRPSVTLQVNADLHQIVMEVVALVADEACRCQVNIRVVPPQNPVKAMCDPLQISQIVLNVLRNSMDALMSVEHREIEVTYSVVSGWVTLHIRDTGPGIVTEILASVGTPFFTTKPTGLGLGISISRSIATQHGGKLTLRNADAHHGGGALVELALPALQE
jgi:C4-dicarboxylate-specific signal transduction histidine kinase